MGQRITRPAKTTQDYLSLPDDVRAELIAGELYVSPSPSMDHQRIVLALARALSDYVDRSGYGEVAISPVDVYLPTGDIVQPDLVVVPRAQAALCRPDGIHGAPQLLIEVLSPGNPERDRIVKRALYAENGVGEYWIVDPVSRGIESFALRAEHLEPWRWFTEEDALSSPSLPGLDLSVRGLFP